ncbi:SMC family ATPase [Paenibacillaceae bacterium]|nr:SMC family ATPase [Paenibacillaceae bacterium]
MRPISLKVAGLQSYRQMQEVDFERLCEAGVFGIFGPTGSGKSTILDAVTLALYGKVERASGGTQGIMNQAEKVLSVSFVFELRDGSEAHRYRVERQFKRGGEVSVNNTLSRFVAITPQGDVVLADKLAEVTRRVEEHIGLTMADFTRAVVLPQGKFAEFLSLTGKERRQMLQRLFHLERYGDGLAARLSQRVKAADSALSEALAEQQGLGDASAAALAAAEARTAAAAEQAAAARAELAAAEAQHAERLQVRERQAELAAAEAQQARLHADAPRFAALEQTLRRLEAAARLMPTLAAAEAADAELRQLAARKEQAGQAYAARQQAAEAASAAWTAAQAESAAAEPRLALRLDQLGQAQQLEGELAAQTAATAATRRGLAEAQARRERFGAEAAKAREKIELAVARQSELKRQLEAVQLHPEERQQRLAMLRSVQQLEAAAEQTAELQRERLSLDEQAAALEETGRRAADEHGRIAAQISALFADWAGSAAALAEDSGQLHQFGQLVEARIEQERLAERRLSLQAMARELAASLKDGAACPVCGSCEHPSAHEGGQLASSAEAEEEGTDREAEVATGQWEKLRGQVSGWLLRNSPLASRLAAAGRRLSKLAEEQLELLAEGVKHGEHQQLSDILHSAERAQAQLEAAAAAQTLAEGREGFEFAETADALERVFGELSMLSADEAQERIKQLGGSAQQLEQRLQGIERASDALAKSRSGLERESAAHAADSKALQRSLAALQRKLEERAQASARALEAWSEAFPETAPEDANAKLTDWERREQEEQDIQTRLEKSVPFIEEMGNKASEGQRQADDARVEAADIAARLEIAEEQLQEKQARLVSWTGGEPAAALQQHAERELAALRNAYQSARERNERETEGLRAAMEQRVTAVEAERSAAERRDQAARQWERDLQDSEFEEAAAVRALEPQLKSADAMVMQIQHYQEARQQAAGQVALLQERLAGRAVSDEQWQETARRLQAARADSDSKLQEAAKAERDWEETASKHQRWSALELRVTETRTLSGRLAQLQTVFRGNAFVEYVAEEQLVQVCKAASERLGYLTKRRYALEVDSGGGFVIRDDAGGGIRRPVSTLSGGETFLASLALALALSTQIQLRGKYPLQFFFLDEGFGTLDPELLETVITALEKLHTDQLSVGVISHVPELRARLPRRLIVTPSEPSGTGSRVQLESM